MELQYAHEFVTLARTGKFQDAADELYLTQPTLSKHILALEKELGQRLIDRSKKRDLCLTGFGQAFLPYALKLSGIYLEMKKDLHPGQSPRKITIGTSPVVPLYTVFRFLDGFLQSHAEYSVEVLDDTQQRLYALLRHGRCDVIIAQRDKESLAEDLCCVHYKSDQLSVVLPPKHPLAKSSSLQFTQLSKERFVLISGSNMLAMAERLSAEAGFSLNRPLTVSRAEAVMDLVVNGSGISLMPSTPARHFAHGGAAVVELEPTVPVEYDLIYRKNVPLSPIVQELLDYLR